MAFPDFSQLADMGKRVGEFIEGQHKKDLDIIARLDRIERRLLARGIIDDLHSEVKADA